MSHGSRGFNALSGRKDGTTSVTRGRRRIHSEPAAVVDIPEVGHRRRQRRTQGSLVLWWLLARVKRRRIRATEMGGLKRVVRAGEALGIVAD